MARSTTRSHDAHMARSTTQSHDAHMATRHSQRTSQPIPPPLIYIWCPSLPPTCYILLQWPETHLPCSLQGTFHVAYSLQDTFHVAYSLQDTSHVAYKVLAMLGSHLPAMTTHHSTAPSHPPTKPGTPAQRYSQLERMHRIPLPACTLHVPCLHVAPCTFHALYKSPFPTRVRSSVHAPELLRQEACPPRERSGGRGQAREG